MSLNSPDDHVEYYGKLFGVLDNPSSPLTVTNCEDGGCFKISATSLPIQAFPSQTLADCSSHPPHHPSQPQMLIVSSYRRRSFMFSTSIPPLLPLPAPSCTSSILPVPPSMLPPVFLFSPLQLVDTFSPLPLLVTFLALPADFQMHPVFTFLPLWTKSSHIELTYLPPDMSLPTPWPLLAKPAIVVLTQRQP